MMMKPISAMLVLIVSVFLIQEASAKVPDCSCCHTCYNATTCKEMGRNPTGNVEFGLSRKETLTYGFSFPEGKDGDDFDVVYTVTVLRTALDGEEPMPVPAKLDAESARKLLITSTGCIYVVSAGGAAQPDIRANIFNGALCEWTRVPGIGENFIVDYAI